MRIIDPTLHTLLINTQSKGNFQQILDLVDFKSHQVISDINQAFLVEIIEQLDIKSTDIKFFHEKVTLDNIIDKIKEHENRTFYSKQYSEEIDFLSANFSIILEQQKEKPLNSL